MRCLSALLPLVLLVGCGGHGGQPSTPLVADAKGKGTAVMTIRWPQRPSARLIPSAANSVVVSLSGTGQSFSQTVARPATGATTGTAAFTGLPYGSYVASIKGYPTTNGTGVPQASGSGTVTVAENVPGTLDVALASTVATLVVGSSGTVLPNRPAQLTASARDARGAVVLLASGGGQEPIAWTNDAPTVADLTPNGLSASLVYRSPGTARVTARLSVDDAGTQVSGSVDVPVSDLRQIVIDPSDAKGIVDHPLTDTPPPMLYAALRDGVSRDNRGNITGYSWNALFPFSGIPAGSTIESASFSGHLAVSGFNVTGHSIKAYDSDSGTVTTAYTPGTPAGTLGNTVGTNRADVTNAIRTLFVGGRSYAGLYVDAIPAPKAPSIGVSTWDSPKLTIVYSPP